MPGPTRPPVTVQQHHGTSSETAYFWVTGQSCSDITERKNKNSRSQRSASNQRMLCLPGLPAEDPAKSPGFAPFYRFIKTPSNWPTSPQKCIRPKDAKKMLEMVLRPPTTNQLTNSRSSSPPDQSSTGESSRQTEVAESAAALRRARRAMMCS